MLGGVAAILPVGRAHTTARACQRRRVMPAAQSRDKLLSSWTEGPTADDDDAVIASFEYAGRTHGRSLQERIMAIHSCFLSGVRVAAPAPAWHMTCLWHGERRAAVLSC